MFLMRKSRATTVVWTLAMAAWTLAIASMPISVALAQSGSRTGASQPPQAGSGSASRHEAVGPAAMPVGLNGYCPVCLVEMKQWVKGDPQLPVEYDGRKYYFPGAEQADMFRREPLKYVPVLSGDDIVQFSRTGERVAGRLDQGLSHKGRPYFFATADNKKLFQSNPDSYAAADLALGGECVVCRVGMNQRVPGSPDFTVAYKGIRYQFPGAEQQAAFLKSPAHYVEALAAPAGAMPAGSGTRPPAAPGQPAGGSGSR